MNSPFDKEDLRALDDVQCVLWDKAKKAEIAGDERTKSFLSIAGQIVMGAIRACRPAGPEVAMNNTFDRNFRDELRRTVMLVAASSTAEVDEWYLQDSRVCVGNCMLWWRKDCSGYTVDLQEALVLTREEALERHADRATDVPWRRSYIDARARRHVDVQQCFIGEASA